MKVSCRKPGPLVEGHLNTQNVVIYHRSIYVDYNASVSVYGIPVYHFVPPPSVFKDHKENPDNIGFCVPNCLKSGVLDVSKCKGAPIIVSQPHFYQGSSDYINAIDGMNPDSMYSTYMDVEPVSMSRMMQGHGLFFILLFKGVFPEDNPVFKWAKNEKYLHFEAQRDRISLPVQSNLKL